MRAGVPVGQCAPLRPCTGCSLRFVVPAPDTPDLIFYTPQIDWAWASSGHRRVVAPLALLLPSDSWSRGAYGDRSAAVRAAAAAAELRWGTGPTIRWLTVSDRPSFGASAVFLSRGKARTEGVPVVTLSGGATTADPDADPTVVVPLNGLRPPGRHNEANAAVALALAAALAPAAAVDEPSASLAARLAGAVPTLEAPPHRLQTVAGKPGAGWWVDDSKATNVESLCVAIAAVARAVAVGASSRSASVPAPPPVLVLVGGLVKRGTPGEPLGFAAAARAAAAAEAAGCAPVAFWAFGAGGAEVADELVAAGARVLGCSEAVSGGSLEAAVVSASALAAKGAVSAVILSPGGASQDEFVDYAARGRAFARWACSGGSMSTV